MLQQRETFHMTVLTSSIFLLATTARCLSLKSPLAYHIAQHSDVTASSQCQSDVNGIACNNTCPSRTQLPEITLKPFLTKGAACDNVSQVAGHADMNNGHVLFSSNPNCTSVSASVNTSTGYYTFSVWFKQSHSFDSTLFEVDSFHKVSVAGDEVVVNGRTITTVDINTWNRIQIRAVEDSNLDVFVNGAKYESLTGASHVRSSAYQLTIGPNAELGSTDVLYMVDARWYQEALTDREVNELTTGRIPTLEVDSNCRCPDSHPALYRSTDDTKQRYLTCTDGQEDTTSRLNPDAHPAVYMVDGDNTTSWVSDTIKDVRITVALKNIMQISAISLHGIQSDMDELTVTLRAKQAISLTMTFRENSCTPPCRALADVLSGSTVSIDLEDEYGSADQRKAYEKMLADTIEIRFENNQSTNFIVSEIEIHARCPCYGNDEDCVINELDYTCDCKQDSNTTGNICETCQDEFYRESTDLDCQYPCNCTAGGSKNNTCEKVGGQCECKSNVDENSRTCDVCKFNTVNLGSDSEHGCTACSCYSEGINTCMSDLTCVCKPNVEQESGNCTHCLPDYYGIRRADGCLPCECDDVGTNDVIPRNCDVDNGQCPCKQYVTGRTCNTCKDDYYKLDKIEPFGCASCDCNFVGRAHTVCDKTTGQCICRHSVEENRQCNPNNLHLEPNFGPLAGGTKITITGDLLGDSSVGVRLTLLDILEQDFRNDTMMVAKTNQHTAVGEVPVTIVWFKVGEKTFKDTNLVFTYKEDPTVTVPNEDITTFASGGCSLDIYGENLDSVPYPHLLMYTADRNITSPCSHNVQSKLITCLTSEVEPYKSGDDVAYGIGLDNVHAYEKFPKAKTSLKIFPDPNVTVDTRIKFRNSFDQKITIKGSGLNTACRDVDVRVLIDNVTCSLISRSETEIVCDPNEQYPGTSREATLVLLIGYFEVEVGKVTFISFWNTDEAYIIIGCVCGGVVLIFALVIAICIYRRCHKGVKGHKRQTGIELRPVAASSNNYTVMPPPVADSTPVAKVKPIPAAQISPTKAFIKRLPTNVAKAVKTSLIDRHHIDLGRVCTQKGGLVRVINGQFSSSSSSPFAGTNLMIKTLIDPYEAKGELPAWLANGLLESTKLRDCYHPNVLTLLGIALDEKHIYVLYPEMANRSLKEYMSSADMPFNETQKLNICIQAAEGMNYLEAEQIVHKDIAARNCWVEATGIAKIGDAAFSWDFYPDEYLLQNDRYQPVRWMAPESLRQPGFYNSKTDLWSFGVLMWEVFTNGCLPYHDIEDDTTIKHCVCDAGYRLGKPQECSDTIYSVIEICQGEDSQARPNFFIILNHLTEIQAGGNPSISYRNQQTYDDDDDDDDDVDYMNTGDIRQQWH